MRSSVHQCRKSEYLTNLRYFATIELLIRLGDSSSSGGSIENGSCISRLWFVSGDGGLWANSDHLY